MSLPYFPMFPSDFEAKTSHLTLAEDGAYNRLLRVCWMTPGCTIPMDEAWIMRRVRAHTDEDKVAVRTILEEYFSVENGRYSNAKLMQIWKDSNDAHERRKNAGSKGGKAKSLKNNDTMSSNVVAKPKQPEPELKPNLSTKKTNKKAKPKSPSLRFGDENDLAYQEFIKRIWPMAWKKGDNPKTAFMAFDKLSKQDRAELQSTLKAASQHFGGKENQFRPMMATWINRNGWLEFSSSQISQQVDWESRMTYFNNGGPWAAGWGAKPYTPGCKVPPQFLTPPQVEGNAA